MHPRLLQLGGISVNTFTAFAVLGMLAALVVARAEARRWSWEVRSITWLVLAATGVGFLGAHLLYAITRLGLPWPQWCSLLAKVWYGNVWYGGVLAAGPLVYSYARRHRLHLGRMCDVASLSVLVAQGLGRIGCFFNGCCYGTPTALPWAVTATNRDYLATGLHPTPLYEAAYLAGLTTWLWRTRRRRPPGQTLALYLLATAAGRFALEFLRGDRVRGFVWSWLSTSQLLALALVTVGAVLYRTINPASFVTETPAMGTRPP